MQETLFQNLPLKPTMISTSIKDASLSRLIYCTEIAKVKVTFTSTLGTPWYYPDSGILLSSDAMKYMRDWPHELAHYLLSGNRKNYENYNLGSSNSVAASSRGKPPRIQSPYLDTEEVLASELGFILLQPHYSWVETNPWTDLLLELNYIRRQPSRYDSNFSLEPTFQDRDVLELLDAKSKGNG